MILALFGTNPYPFNRLLGAINKFSHETGARVIVQSGNTPPVSETLECHPFVDHAQLVRWITEAELVICQGGFGSLLDCIAQRARVVAVPRDISLGESIDDQNELVRVLSDEGLVVPVYDVLYLPKAITQVRSMGRKPRLPSKMPGHVAETIEKLIAEH